VMRNEISPRQGPLRLREFTIMEMEMFFDPSESHCEFLNRVKDIELPLLLAKERELGGSNLTYVKVTEATTNGYVKTEWSAYFMALSILFAKKLGVPYEKQRFEEKLPAERAHYSAQTFDHQILLDRWGWVEIAGHAYRTDFDLNAHIKHSGMDLSIFKPYPQPIEKKATVVVPNGSALGPILREKTSKIVTALSAANPEELKNSFEKSNTLKSRDSKFCPLKSNLSKEPFASLGDELFHTWLNQVMGPKESFTLLSSTPTREQKVGLSYGSPDY